MKSELKGIWLSFYSLDSPCDPVSSLCVDTQGTARTLPTLRGSLALAFEDIIILFLAFDWLKSFLLGQLFTYHVWCLTNII